VLDPAVILVGHFRCQFEENWISYVLGHEGVTLDGCFSAAELRRLADMLEPAP